MSTKLIRKTPDRAVREITALYCRMCLAGRRTLQDAVHIGEILAQNHAAKRHGEWLQWLRLLPFDQKTAWRWETLYQNRAKLGTMPSLGITQSLKLLTAEKKHLKVRNSNRPVVADDRTNGVVSDLSELKGQKFGTIYADPPWKYDNQGTRGATDNHYPTMTVADLCALPIGDLASAKCHLHLWTTNAFLFECPKIFEAWGFEFKSSFIWVKHQMGIGNYWRNSHEILLLGVRGRLTGASRSEISWLSSGRNRHSQKPEEVRKRIERLSPPPRLELFGRKAVAGWTVYANEVEGLVRAQA